MNRYFKLLFVAIFSGCIIAYTNLFNRSFFNGYCSNNATWQQSQGESDSHVANSLDLCRGDGVKQCIPPLMRFKQLYRTSKPNSLIACVIEKSFSTFLTAIMCFLHDPQTFKDSNRTLDSDIFGDRLCKDKNEFTELKKIGSWQKMSIFTVVRNPIDRRCEFSSHLVKYQIFQLDGANFTNQLLGLLSERGVDENGINFINGSLHHRTPHSTMDSVERAAVEETVLSSPYLLRKIIQMYYFDFLLFGYKLPDIPVGN